MPRCPDCNHFVSLNTSNEPEIDSLEVYTDLDTLIVSAEVTIVNQCLDCGTDLTTGTIELTARYSTDPIVHKDNCPTGNRAYTVEETGTERFEAYKGKGNSARTSYGVTIYFDMTCEECKAGHNDSVSESIQASQMEPA